MSDKNEQTDRMREKEGRTIRVVVCQAMGQRLRTPGRGVRRGQVITPNVVSSLSLFLFYFFDSFFSSRVLKLVGKNNQQKDAGELLSKASRVQKGKGFFVLFSRCIDTALIARI